MEVLRNFRCLKRLTNHFPSNGLDYDTDPLRSLTSAEILVSAKCSSPLFFLASKFPNLQFLSLKMIDYDISFDSSVRFSAVRCLNLQFSFHIPIWIGFLSNFDNLIELTLSQLRPFNFERIASLIDTIPQSVKFMSFDRIPDYGAQIVPHLLSKLTLSILRIVTRKDSDVWNFAVDYPFPCENPLQFYVRGKMFYLANGKMTTQNLFWFWKSWLSQ